MIMHYSVQSKDRIFVKVYGFLSFAKNMGKNISKNLSSKYSQNLRDHAEQSATDVFQIGSKRAMQKTAAATGGLISSKIANKIIKVSKNSLQNNSEAVTNEKYKEIPKQRYISPDERQKIIDEKRLINFLDNAPNQPTKFGTK